MIDEVVLGKEALSPCVVARGEVNLGEPESVIGIAWKIISLSVCLYILQSSPVSASSLSPMYMAESY